VEAVTKGADDRPDQQISPERRLQLLINAVTDYAIYMLDQDGHVTSWNSGAKRAKGYTEDEILGRHFEIFYTPEDRAAGHPERALEVAAAEGIYREEGWRVRKDGCRFWASVVVEAIHDADDHLLGFSKVTHDVSARRRDEERFRRVVESAPNAIVMVNSAGLIEMVNAQTEQLFGYERRELLGKPVEMLMPEHFRYRHPELRQTFLTDPQSRPMGVGRDLFAVRKDGTEFPVEIGLNPIETDEGLMVLSSIADISLRRRSEMRFRQVVESTPNAIVMVNHSGSIEMVNQQAERLFGYRRHELLGRAIEDLVPARFRAHHPNLRSQFFGNLESRPMGAGRDLYALRKDGTEVPVEIGLNPIATEEGEMVLSAIVDISDRKQKEERIQTALKEKDALLREKDILLAEIHHRVKNNLQVVDSLLGLQAARVTDQVALGTLRDSQNRIRSMALIHQTLYQSKDFAEINFTQLLDALVPQLISSYGIDPKRIKLSVSMAAIDLPINSAVPCGLIVNELMSNALKHAFPNGRQGRIELNLASEEADGVEYVILTFADDGIGIPAHVDIDNPVTLGLQLLPLLASQLHGTLRIERADPTRLTLRFPNCR
jgi:PAS domain S-box-containing protein